MAVTTTAPRSASPLAISCQCPATSLSAAPAAGDRDVGAEDVLDAGDHGLLEAGVGGQPHECGRLAVAAGGGDAAAITARPAPRGSSPIVRAATP